ncbi:hypothetical protein Bca52824_036553 [Brassica carinata]|uniref:Prolyl 4-hydroxylase alpha subunit domain-containing protein n=1 Tax=Brassica carinata TaxID=52824 RepID=A0A8X7V533_BRACI|nr:hypothetical protein Bca52824_036553 [Brassica carinata]
MTDDVQPEIRSPAKNYVGLNPSVTPLKIKPGSPLLILVFVHRECEYIKAIASPRLQVSTVVGVKNGEGVKSDVRTSSGMFLTHVERGYPMIQAIEKRISVFSQAPAENGELIQVLRCVQNCNLTTLNLKQFNLKRGGQRVATMLMYLTDDVEGGETYFPLTGDGECTCGGKIMKGISVKPTKGDAVRETHGGEIVTKEKRSSLLLKTHVTKKILKPDYLRCSSRHSALLSFSRRLRNRFMSFSRPRDDFRAKKSAETTSRPSVS